MKVSIIIPVYNAGKYLDECVDSVKKQSYQKWELLLVDDGSNDGSREKCVKFAEEDERIHTFFNDHGGVSSARNAALEKADGDILMFMDNDDYWKEKNLLEDIVHQMEIQKADMMLFKRTEFWPDGKVLEKGTGISAESLSGKNKAEAVRFCIEKNILTRAVWTKAVKREVFTQNNIKFPEGKRNEDIYVTGKLLLTAKKIGWCSTATYMYRKGTGVSQSDKKVSDQTITDLRDMCADYIETVEKMSEPEELKKGYFSYIAYPFAVWMMYAADNKMKNDINEMKKYAKVLEYDYNPYIKSVKKIYRLCGYKMTVWAMGLYSKIGR